jgi:hypothetical protein
MTESRAAGSVGGVGRADIPAECSAATSALVGGRFHQSPFRNFLPKSCTITN